QAPSRLRGAGLGLLLSCLLLTDTVVFLIAGAAFGLWYLSSKGARSRLTELPFLAATVLAIIALAWATGIFVIPEHSNRIILSPYLAAIVAFPAFVLLIFGPLPIAAVLEVKKRAKTFLEERSFLAVLLLVSLFFMLFVTETLEGNVFLRKSLLVMRLSLFV